MIFQLDMCDPVGRGLNGTTGEDGRVRCVVMVRGLRLLLELSLGPYRLNLGKGKRDDGTTVSPVIVSRSREDSGVNGLLMTSVRDPTTPVTPVLKERRRSPPASLRKNSNVYSLTLYRRILS